MRARRRCGFHRLTRAWRLAAGAFSVCSTYAVALGTNTLAGQAPSSDQEVGMAHWGSTYVWLRVTDPGLVQVYASTGYRSAFVQPVTLTTSDVDRWISLLDQLTESTDARPASMTSDDASRRPTNDDNSHVVLGAGDLVLEVETAPASEPKLRVCVGATRSDAVVALLVPEAAADAASMLREAARRARNLASAPSVAKTPTPPPLATTATEPTATPAASVAVAVSAPVVVASVPRTESTDAPISDAPVTVVHPETVPAPVSPVASAAEAAPALATASTSAPLVSRRTTTTVASIHAAGAHASSVRDAHESALPVLRTTTSTRPMHVAASALGTVRTVNTAPERENTHQRPTGIAAAPRTSRSTGADDAHGVDDAMVQNLVGQWRPDLMYCYTQYGLREHAALSGALVVRLALSPNGSVGHSVIGGRRWSGDGGTDVESCIRSRIAGWHFPPARAGSIHTFSLEFAPGRN